MTPERPFYAPIPAPEEPVPGDGARIDLRPHPITDEGRTAIVAAPGATLAEALHGHVGPDDPARAIVNGAAVPRRRWDDVALAEGDIVSVRVTVEGGGGGSNPIAVVLTIAVIVAAPYLAGAVLGVAAASVGATLGGALLVGAIQVGGILLVNTLFPPRLPSAPEPVGQAPPQFTLQGGSNRARPYDPLLLVLGTWRVFPDLVAREYSSFDENGDQYLHQIFDFGIGDLAVERLQYGETDILDFEGISLQSKFVVRNAPDPETPSGRLAAPALEGSGVQTTFVTGGRGGGDTIKTTGPRLEWTAVDGASGYQISIDGGAWRAAPKNRVRIYRARNGLGQRAYRVRAVAGSTVGPASAEVTLPKGTMAPAPVVPAAPLDPIPKISSTLDPDLSRITLVAGNVDTIPGGELAAEAPLQRTTAGETTEIAFDLVSQHFRVEEDGGLAGDVVEFALEWREAGTADGWSRRDVTIETPSGARARNVSRRSYRIATGKAAAWDVRVTRLTAGDEEEARLTLNASVAAFRAFQDDQADFTARNPLAVRAKASGQLYGRLEAVNAEVSQRIDSWNGAAWVPRQASSNPADVLLAYVRGWRREGVLVAGMGRADERIDLESIQGFADHCREQGLTCDMVLDRKTSHAAVLRTICQCGWGRVDFQTGKLGVIWENADEPMSGLVTPANIVANSLKISYDHTGLADEIVGTFVDRASGWEPNTIRRNVPGVDFPERPAEVRLDGVVDGENAAKEINRSVAAQAYHRRVIGWTMTLDEAQTISVGDVVGASHGLLGAGSGGRLLAIAPDRASVKLGLGMSVASDGIAWFWLLDGRVVSRGYTMISATEIALDQSLPAPPGGADDDPAAYRVMAFDSENDLVRLRVTSKEPSGRRMKLIARDEDARYYDHRTSDLSWTPLDTLADPASVPVGSLDVEVNALGVRIFRWSSHPSQAVAGYQLRYGAAGAEWEAMEDLHDGLVTSSPLSLVDRPDAGEWRFGIVAVLADRRVTPATYVTASLGALPRTGEDFAEIEVYKVVDAGDPAPETPEGGSFNFRDGALTPPDGWVGPAFPAYDADQVVYASTTTADRSEGDLWTPDEDDWSAPVIVGDADDLNIIYRRFQAAPAAAPAPSQGIPADWHDLVKNVPAGPDPIYVSIGVRRRGSELYTWQLPTQLEGQDAVTRKELTAYRVQAVTAAAPANPGAKGRYNFATGLFTPPAGWVFPFPARTPQQVVYAVTATASDQAADRTRQEIWRADANDWIGPVRISDEGDLNIIYTRSVDRPAEPANSSGVPAGWYDRVSSVPVGKGRIWIAIGVRVSGTSEFDWGAPTLLQGKGIASIERNPATGVVTLTFDDGTTDTFTVEGVRSVSADDDGDLTVVFSDGSSWTIPAGRVGRGIESIVRNARTGVVTIRYDDGSVGVTFTLQDGEDGRGVRNIFRSSTTGLVTITYTDGLTDSFTVPDGEDGSSITLTGTQTLSNGDIRLTFSDGTTVTVPKGRGIRSVVRNTFSGLVTVTYDDGATSTFAIMDGEDGENGSSSEWIYRATSTNVRPATPASINRNDYVPPGWNDDPVAGNFVWVSKRTKPAGSNTSWGSYSRPENIRGEKGDPGEDGLRGEAGPPGPRVWQRLWTGSKAIGSDAVTITWDGGRVARDYDAMGVQIQQLTSPNVGVGRELVVISVLANVDSVPVGGRGNFKVRGGGSARSVTFRRINAAEQPVAVLGIWGVDNV